MAAAQGSRFLISKRSGRPHAPAPEAIVQTNTYTPPPSMLSVPGKPMAGAWPASVHKREPPGSRAARHWTCSWDMPSFFPYRTRAVPTVAHGTVSVRQSLHRPHTPSRYRAARRPMTSPRAWAQSNPLFLTSTSCTLVAPCTCRARPQTHGNAACRPQTRRPLAVAPF